MTLHPHRIRLTKDERRQLAELGEMCRFRSPSVALIDVRKDLRKNEAAEVVLRWATETKAPVGEEAPPESNGKVGLYLKLTRNYLDSYKQSEVSDMVSRGLRSYFSRYRNGWSETKVEYWEGFMVLPLREKTALLDRAFRMALDPRQLIVERASLQLEVASRLSDEAREEVPVTMPTDATFRERWWRLVEQEGGSEARAKMRFTQAGRELRGDRA